MIRCRAAYNRSRRVPLSENVHITPISDPITDLDLITEFEFYLIARGFHRTSATGAACHQRTLTPPGTWSCPTLGLASVLNVQTNLSWTCLVSGLLSFEHPSVLLFLLNRFIDRWNYWGRYKFWIWIQKLLVFLYCLTFKEKTFYKFKDIPRRFLSYSFLLINYLSVT